jgi:hypothetical protein
MARHFSAGVAHVVGDSMLHRASPRALGPAQPWPDGIVRHKEPA